MDFFIPKAYLYYTFWNIVLIVFHQFVHQHFNLLLSSLVVSCFSLIMTYIEPRKLDIQTSDGRILRLKGCSLIIFDIFVHHLPLLFVFIKYMCYYSQNKYSYATSVTVLVVLLYMITMNPYKLYDMSPKFAALAFATALIIYVLLPKVKC